MYYEVAIRRGSEGYEAKPINGGDDWESEDDLVAEMRTNDNTIVEIPSDDAESMAIETPVIQLPASVPALSRLFAVLSDADGAPEVVGYVGIARRDA